MKIDTNCIVSVTYTLTNEKGEVLDQSPEGEPLVYMHGAIGVVPALETALEGRSSGENFDVTVTPADAFGEHQSTLVQTVPRNAFPIDGEIQVGTRIMVPTQQGEVPVSIAAFDDDTLTIDANHPLAGMTLRFVGDIENVRMASEEEVKHWPNPVPTEGQESS